MTMPPWGSRALASMLAPSAWLYVKAQLKDGYLTISAQTKQDNDQKDENGKFIRRERYYGSCSRSFYVGEELKEEDIKAKFENGILTISIPKKEAKAQEIETPKYIAIEG